MSDSPSTPAGNGRDRGGRFTPGNHLGRGNPHARRVARLRSAMLKAVTPDDVREVVAAMLMAAKAGDVQAAKELLQRLLGPPESLDLLERLDVLESRVGNLSDDEEE